MSIKEVLSFLSHFCTTTTTTTVTTTFSTKSQQCRLLLQKSVSYSTFELYTASPPPSSSSYSSQVAAAALCRLSSSRMLDFWDWLHSLALFLFSSSLFFSLFKSWQQSLIWLRGLLFFHFISIHFQFYLAILFFFFVLLIIFLAPDLRSPILNDAAWFYFLMVTSTQAVNRKKTRAFLSGHFDCSFTLWQILLSFSPPNNDSLKKKPWSIYCFNKKKPGTNRTIYCLFYMHYNSSWIDEIGLISELFFDHNINLLVVTQNKKWREEGGGKLSKGRECKSTIIFRFCSETIKIIVEKE